MRNSSPGARFISFSAGSGRATRPALSTTALTSLRKYTGFAGWRGEPAEARSTVARGVNVVVFRRLAGVGCGFNGRRIAGRRHPDAQVAELRRIVGQRGRVCV